MILPITVGLMTRHEIEEQARLYVILSNGKEIRDHERADYRRVARKLMWMLAQRWRR